ncbi:FecR family protein [Aneurinibacillus uraniidurans]|uniref:FecR family protein n=1 Tax=Aneurinibacillus uraniidurans TaxID=2966586 RepID=UPI00234BE524|nr:FecR family protein [Aneurinibacillus sp. B1]WCN37281.1 FecR family protein [Aneurinibacillus sp. B1]
MSVLRKTGMLLILVLFVVSSIGIADTTVMAAARTAKLASVKGDVKVQKSGSKKVVTAFNSMSLSQGDTVITGKNSSAKVVYSAGTQSTLGSGTRFMIAQMAGGKTKGKVWSGQVWNKVESLANANDRFDIETPTAIMGVRGTLFLVTVEPCTGETYMTVEDGVVAVTTRSTQQKGQQTGQQTILVRSGQQVTITSQYQNPADKQSPIDPGSIISKASPEIIDQMVQDMDERKSKLITEMQQLADTLKKGVPSTGSTGGGSGSSDGGTQLPAIPIVKVQVVPATTSNHTAKIILGGVNAANVAGIELHALYASGDVSSPPTGVPGTWGGATSLLKSQQIYPVAGGKSELIFAQLLPDAAVTQINETQSLAELSFPITRSTTVEILALALYDNNGNTIPVQLPAQTTVTLPIQ